MQTIVTTSPYFAIPNSFKYYYTNFDTNVTGVFNLPDVAESIEPIYVINIGLGNVTINSEVDGILENLVSNQNGLFIVKPATASNISKWIEISSSPISYSTAPLVSSVGNALIPILTSDLAQNNKDNWGLNGSSFNTGNDFFNSFNNGGGYWLPLNTFAQYLTITSPLYLSSSPIPQVLIVKGLSICFRGGSSTNYFTGVSFSGSNNGSIYSTLYSFSNTQTQTNFPNVVYVNFENEISYTSFQLFITNTVGTLSNLGIYSIQLYGYWNLVI